MVAQPDKAAIETMSLDGLATALQTQATAVKNALAVAQRDYAKDKVPELYTLYNQFRSTFDGIRKLYGSLDSVRSGVEAHQKDSFLGEYRGLDHNVRKSIEDVRPSLDEIETRIRRGKANDALKTAHAETQNFYAALPTYLDRFNKLKEETQTVPDSGFWYRAPGIKYVTKLISGSRLNKGLSYLLFVGSAVIAHYAVGRGWKAWKKHRAHENTALQLTGIPGSSSSSQRKRHSFAGFCCYSLASISPLLGAWYGLPRLQDHLDRANGERKHQVAQLQEEIRHSYDPLIVSIREEEKDLAKLERLLQRASEKDQRRMRKSIDEMRAELEKMKGTLAVTQRPGVR